MFDLLLLISPALGGGLAVHLWASRRRRNAAQHAGLSVGQIPVSARRGRAQAVRREVAHG